MFLLLSLTPWYKQLGEERVYLFHHAASIPSSKELKAGTWRRDLMQRPWGALLTGLLLMDFSVCFLIATRVTSPGEALLYQLSINKMFHRLPHRPIWWWHFLTWGSYYCLGDQPPAAQRSKGVHRVTILRPFYLRE